MECGRRHLWQCHSADPGFTLKTVNPTTVFAQGAIFQIIVFHLKNDKSYQLLIMDSTSQIEFNLDDKFLILNLKYFYSLFKI